MLVTKDNFSEVLSHLEKKKVLAIDTETTSLRVHHGAKLFGIAISDGESNYYFNFNDQNEIDKANGVEPLPRSSLWAIKRFCENPDITWVLANAKYDMHILLNDRIRLRGPVYDVLVMARLERNDHMTYSLDACAKRIGYDKSDGVLAYLKEKRFSKKVEIPGKKGRITDYQFWMCPLHIIQPYAEQDAFITMKLYEHQMKHFSLWDAEREPNSSIMRIVQNEMALTKICFDIERIGIKLDTDYVKKALEHEQKEAQKHADEYEYLTGEVLVDSPKAIEKALAKVGLKGGKTEKGGASFTSDILEKLEHPATRALLAYRDAIKRSTSYYSSFLYHADSTSVVHCNIRQSATTTGRFSITDPALQTLSAEDDYTVQWRIRKSFVPRNGYIFVAIDYKAFEFRAMLDTAGEKELAYAIEQGLDPHQATADLVGISRKQAKTLNFGLLYGMGSGKLADALGCSVDEAKRIKRQYFDKLPKIRELINYSQYVAENNQRVINRFGRPYFFPDPKWAYKALNALIQGGTADAIKFAMTQIHSRLNSTGCKSRMVLQIHDELLFEIHTTEFSIIGDIVKIMEKAWPSKFHSMSCSVEYSDSSWGNLDSQIPSSIGYPYGSESRDSI